MSEYPGSYSSAIDVSSVELYWDVPGDPLYHPFVFAFLQGVTRDRGASVWIQPTEHGISGTSSPVEIQLRGLECLGWGVAPEFVESARRQDYLRLHVENVKAREAWVAGTRAVSHIGIVASEETRALFGKAALPLHVSHALGAFRSILETHWPVRILTEYDLEDGDLHGVRVVVLPNVAALSDRAAEVIRRFVLAGGGLVATFESSLYDATFRRRPDFALGDLFRAKHGAAHHVGQRADNLQLTLEGRHPLTDDPEIRRSMDTAWRNPGGPAPETGPLALVAGAVRVTALEGGELVASCRLAGSARDPGPHPAIIVSRHGKGRVAYFAAALDQAMFFYPDAAHRKLLVNACQWAARDEPPLLEVKGPLVLCATFREQPETGRLVVHLLNAASSWGQHSISQKLPPLPEEVRRRWELPDLPELRSAWPIREEVVPLRDLQVTCRRPGVRKATLEPGGLDLPLTRSGDVVVVTVPRVDMHAMVVFE